MTFLAWWIVVLICGVLVYWARRMEDPRKLRRAWKSPEEIKFEKDQERAVRHRCPLCKTDRTFLECRLTGRESMSCWIPNLRFCIECGTVLHIEEVSVPE